MKRLCVIFLLTAAAVSLEIHDQPEDVKNIGGFERPYNKLNNNYNGQQNWLNQAIDWLKKSKPCGQADFPLCPIQVTTVDPTRAARNSSPTTRNLKQLPTKSLMFTKILNGPMNRELTTRRFVSTASTQPFLNTRKPVLITEESKPIFATTSAPQNIMSTQQIQAVLMPTTTRPFAIPPYDGAIVFPDDDEGPSRTTKPYHKSTPSEDVVFEKDPASTTSTTATSNTTQDCIRNCLVTSEYNPVCGSDGVTYNNPGRLLCSQFCGVNVNMVSRGACRSTTVKQPLTTPLPSLRTTRSPAVQECIRKCPVTDEYNPVCGSDGVTYMNLGRVNCAYLCGISIRVESLGPCVSTSSTTTSPARVTHSPATRQCILNCPVTSEYNPVCGSDGFTYTNPKRLICAQRCGINVQQRARGPCTMSSIASSTSTTMSPRVQQCMKRCPVTSEYSPICGSDGVTYNNDNHLRCAQGCQVDVWQKAYGRCPKTLRQ